MNDFKNSSWKNILIVSTSFPKFLGDSAGGFIYELGIGLSEHFNISVLAPKPKSNKNSTFDFSSLKVYRHRQFPFDLIELAYGDGIISNLKKYKYLYFAIPFFLIYQFLKVAEIVKKENIEIINAHWIPSGLTSVLYKVIFNRKIKVVVTIHGTDYWGLKHLMGTWLKKFVLHNADKLIVVSRPMEQNLLEEGCQIHINVCSMGVNTESFSPENINQEIINTLKPTGKEKVILFVGRLIKEKGVYTLIDAFSKVIKRINNAKLVFIGEGSIKNDLISFTNRLKIDDKVVFLGKKPRNSLPYYYNSADLFVLPSHSEGFPLVVMEALSCGLPVIVTELPVFTTLENADKILNIMKIDDTKDLLDIIMEIFNQDASKVDEQKRINREYALKYFSWKSITEKYKQILESL